MCYVYDNKITYNIMLSLQDICLRSVTKHKLKSNDYLWLTYKFKWYIINKIKLKNIDDFIDCYPNIKISTCHTHAVIDDCININYNYDITQYCERYKDIKCNYVFANSVVYDPFENDDTRQVNDLKYIINDIITKYKTPILIDEIYSYKYDNYNDNYNDKEIYISIFTMYYNNGCIKIKPNFYSKHRCWYMNIAIYIGKKRIQPEYNGIVSYVNGIQYYISHQEYIFMPIPNPNLDDELLDIIYYEQFDKILQILNKHKL